MASPLAMGFKPIPGFNEATAQLAYEKRRGAFMACDLQKPVICITQKDKPGFRPDKLDLATEGKKNLLIADAMVQTGIHLEKALRRIEKKGGNPIAILVVVDNDLAADERVLEKGEKVPLESIFKLSNMKDEITRIHGWS